MSFTAGAILSAYAMGGVGSLLSKAGTALKLGSSAFTGAQEIGAISKAMGFIPKALSNSSKGVGFTSRMIVGAGYEGGV
jgi:hypothetical protein